MYKILSLDGGGVYGSLTIVIIERLLKKYPKLIENADLITGTSIGGVIGLMLAKGISCQEIKSIFPKAAEEIFTRDTCRMLGSLAGMKAFYSNKNLKKEAEKYFGNTTLGELNKKVLVPAFNLDNQDDIARHWSAKFFHNFDGYGYDFDQKVKVVDVIMATTAAPVFFPTYENYIDGSVVENNPSICAIAQTQDERIKLEPRPKFEELLLYSIGRSNPRRYVEGNNLDWGYFNWINPMINIALDRDASVVDYQAAKLMRERYHRTAPLLPEELDQKIDAWDIVPSLLSFAEQIDISDTEKWLEKNWI